MKLLGEDGVAAVTILLYVQFLLTTLYIGFSMGVAPVISYHYGLKQRTSLQYIIGLCFCFVLTGSVFVFLLSFFAGTQIVGIFAAENRAVFDLARKGFTIFSFSFLFSGCNIFVSALFTALSDGKTSAILSFLRTFGFITISLLVLPTFLQVTGIWLAVPVAELLTFLLAAIMKLRNPSRMTLLIAILLIVSVTAGFATSEKVVGMHLNRVDVNNMQTVIEVAQEKDVPIPDVREKVSSQAANLSVLYGQSRTMATAAIIPSDR